MNKKRNKVLVRVSDDEVVVVGPRDRWEHLIEVYEGLAGWYPSSSRAWKESAEWIRTWLQKAGNEEGG